MKTNVLLITDASGSMSELRHDVIGGQRAYLSTLVDDVAANGGEYSITQVVFNTKVTRIDVAAPLPQATWFTSEYYYPRGMTALYDAIGEAITAFMDSAVLADGDKVAVFITTDGEENSSREWQAEAVHTLLAEREQAGWAIVYGGVGPDGWANRTRLGRQHGSTQTLHEGSSVAATYAAYGQGTIAHTRSAGGLNSTEMSGLVQAGINEAADAVKPTP